MSFEWLTPACSGSWPPSSCGSRSGRRRCDPDAERQARDLRDEIARSAQGTRQEVVATLGDFQRTLLAQQGDVARTQNELIEAFGRQLAATQQQLGGARSARRRSRRSSRRGWLAEALDADARGRRARARPRR